MSKALRCHNQLNPRGITMSNLNYSVGAHAKRLNYLITGVKEGSIGPEFLHLKMEESTHTIIDLREEGVGPIRLWPLYSALMRALHETH